MKDVDCIKHKPRFCLTSTNYGPHIVVAYKYA